mmetsp:Transcript_40878/g.46924  ORF Transcript_40878/g.46924 Transcript_40878/m.46924 type:complete len:82 (+) Transcript_40878:1503-1748(+)
MMSPLQFSSEFLKERSTEGMEKFNHSALRTRYFIDLDNIEEDRIDRMQSLPFRVAGAKGNSADLINETGRPSKALKSFDVD